jgi:hypothetical protein
MGFAGAALGLAGLLGGIQRLADGVYHLGDLLLAAAALALSLCTALVFRRKDYTRAASFALAASFAVTASALGIIAPNLDAPWVAKRLVAALPRSAEGRLPPLIVSGYSEPSLVFLAGTHTAFLPPAEASDRLAVMSDDRIIAAISTDANPAFLHEMIEMGLHFTAIGQVSGYNYSIGKPVTLILYKARP